MTLQNRHSIAPTNSPLIDLAERLVSRLGYADALQACQENHWLGAKQLIQKRRSRLSLG